MRIGRFGVLHRNDGERQFLSNRNTKEPESTVCDMWGRNHNTIYFKLSNTKGPSVH